MAAALLLRPVPSPEQQFSEASVFSASRVSSLSSHGSFSFVFHHRRPQSFRPTISRVTQVQEDAKKGYKSSRAPTDRFSKNPAWQQRKASNAASDNRRPHNPPPWQKNSFDEASTDDFHPNARKFRPAPWQQGSCTNSASPPSKAPWQHTSDRRGGVDSMPGQHGHGEGDKSAMSRIVEKLRTIQETHDPVVNARPGQKSSFRDGPRNGQRERASTRQSVSYNSGSRVRTGQRITHDQSGRAGTATPHGQSDRARIWRKDTGSAATDTSQSNFNGRTSANGKGSSMQAELSLSGIDSEAATFPWERDEEAEQKQKMMQKIAKAPRIPSLAEQTLDREELKRLRIQGLELPERLKIGKLGVTSRIITTIHEDFTTNELVKVRCEGEAAASIKKTHLELEEKTGGLVVLRTGKIIVVYRGSDYAEQTGMMKGLERKVESMSSSENPVNIQAETPAPDVCENEGLVDEAERNNGSEPAGHTEVDADAKAGLTASGVNAIRAAELQAKRETDIEAENLLEGLGPRYENWLGLAPVPIDADLLPMVIPNYRPPFRLLPYGSRPTLNDAELTDLRRRARPLAPHFVLGRNRGHHGLAAAMVKFWEKSEIVKVAVKKRVQNTNNLIMSDELKRLTGGVLLARDKYFITFFRGNDFIPEKVASALVEREASVRDLQESEEKAREERSIPVMWTSPTKPSMAVIGQEAPAVKPSWEHTMDVKEQIRLKREVAKVKRIGLAQQMEKKLHVALRKKQKAEQDLRKVELFMKPLDRPIDVETITEEERVMFRKLGLKMKAYLLIGRRGVFDGVVENMHLHWKHRELVKILMKEVDESVVQETARTLEYESGGVLVAVTPTKQAQAIIMYRGKNYERPTELRPRNLLTKRKALKRSLELQRSESLSKNIEALEDRIHAIKAELRILNEANDEGSQAREGSENSHQDHAFSKAKSDELLENKESKHVIEDIEDRTRTKSERRLMETEVDRKVRQERIKELENLVRAGPIFRADRLTNPERLRLRKEALSYKRATQFFVGKNNGLEGLARGIRLYFLHHDLAVIVVKGRSPGMVMENLVHDLEELTGGALVAQEVNKIILYRGWPRGDKIPSAESFTDLTPELLSALEAEEDWEEDVVENYLVDVSEESEADDEDDWLDVRSFISDSDNELGTDEEEGLDEGSEDDHGAQYTRSTYHVKSDANAESDDGEDDESDDEEDDDWVVPWGRLDDSGREDEEDEEGVEEEEEDSAWDFEDSDDDDDDDDAGEESDSPLYVDGVNGTSATEAKEVW